MWEYSQDLGEELDSFTKLIPGAEDRVEAGQVAVKTKERKTFQSKEKLSLSWSGSQSRCPGSRPVFPWGPSRGHCSLLRLRGYTLPSDSGPARSCSPSLILPQVAGLLSILFNDTEPWRGRKKKKFILSESLRRHLVSVMYKKAVNQ
jgi:hypothetical protein